MAHGIFLTHVVSGQEISKKQIVGYVTDPFGDFKVPIKSPLNGFIIGLNNNPLLHQGDAIMHIGMA